MIDLNPVAPSYTASSLATTTTAAAASGLGLQLSCQCQRPPDSVHDQNGYGGREEDPGGVPSGSSQRNLRSKQQN